MLSMEGGISISEDPNIRFTYIPNGAKRIRVEAKDTEGTSSRANGRSTIPGSDADRADVEWRGSRSEILETSDFRFGLGAAQIIERAGRPAPSSGIGCRDRRAPAPCSVRFRR